MDKIISAAEAFNRVAPDLKTEMMNAGTPYPAIEQVFKNGAIIFLMGRGLTQEEAEYAYDELVVDVFVKEQRAGLGNG